MSDEDNHQIYASAITQQVKALVDQIQALKKRVQELEKPQVTRCPRCWHAFFMSEETLLKGTILPPE